MKKSTTFLILVFLVLLSKHATAQVVINEGSNRNYNTIRDENGDYPDWIELHNITADTLYLLNYSLTDNIDIPTKWILPNVVLPPHSFKTIFCSGKDRAPLTGFQTVATPTSFSPIIGWNTHPFDFGFYWDGVSNLLINTCSYSSVGYTSNSVVNQTSTDFLSSAFALQDGSNDICWAEYGNPVAIRPNIQFNGINIGTGTVTNSPTDYPAPYGNWYWAAKHQFLIHADELIAAGLTAGNLNNIAFDVVSTDPNTVYDYLEISLKMVSQDGLGASFDLVDPNNNLHTNFKIDRGGEKIYLYDPQQQLVSSLIVDSPNLDSSNGLSPDGSSNIVLFATPTPATTNNTSATYSATLEPPTFSAESGIFDEIFEVSISNPNTVASHIHYTLDGSEPSANSATYTGTAIPVFYSTVLKARSFADTLLPSSTTTASYLLGISHNTPVLSVVTDPQNLYGNTGIFDNWGTDWQRATHVDYFDSTKQHIFSQKAGMQIDGGWGGSRSQPQHSFRIELDNGVLGEGSIEYPLIPNRPNRTKYSNIYLRNGSNQYLVLPYKDACQVEMMAAQTNNYYSAWRPITVYINGGYFGLYELREKFDAEYFKTLDDADTDSLDILSLSAWGNGILRPVEGATEHFWADYQAFNTLDPTAPDYWQQADQYIDLSWYTDYIIGESWMGNTDWPGNNIKIYRSNATDFRWRFCLIDQELAMAPNSWTDCYLDHIAFMLSQSTDNPYINIWLQSLQNEQYRHYFINRFADVMNTAYRNERLLDIENTFFDLTAIEMQKEFARWGDPNNIAGQMQSFYDNHQTFRTQLAARTEQVRQHIQDNFQLPNQVEVTLYAQPEGSGAIRISTITPDTNPWQGIYFNGVPIQIEAIPAPGYNFSHWSGNNLITTPNNPLFSGILANPAPFFQANFVAYNTAIEPSATTSTAFSLAPNPATNVLWVQKNTSSTATNKPTVCQIIDLTGRIVLEQKIINTTTAIDISQLPASVYVCQMIQDGSVINTLQWVKIGQ
jgi:hypothetical protein